MCARFANTQIIYILTKIRTYTPSYTELEITIRSLECGCPFAQGDLAWTVNTSVFEMSHISNRKLNDKVVTFQRKISIADEEIFFDICACGFKEGDEQSMAVRECGASNGRVQGFPVQKINGQGQERKSGLEKKRYLRLRRLHGKNAVRKMQRKLTHR